MQKIFQIRYRRSKCSLPNIKRNTVYIIKKRIKDAIPSFYITSDSDSKIISLLKQFFKEISCVFTWNNVKTLKFEDPVSDDFILNTICPKIKENNGEVYLSL